MFCKYCGSQLDDNSVVCPNCGAKLNASNPEQNNQTNNPPPPTYSQPPQQKSGNTVAIVGFVLAFFIPLAGLICSIIGLRKANNENAGHKGLAIAGIIISIVVWIFNFIFSSVFLKGFIEGFLSELGGYGALMMF